MGDKKKLMGTSVLGAGITTPVRRVKSSGNGRALGKRLGTGDQRGRKKEFAIMV